MSAFAIKSKRIVTPTAIFAGRVIVEDGRIQAIPHEGEAGYASLPEVDVGDQYVAPGFVDMHVHGGGGHDFMDATLESIEGAARLHLKHGTTAMAPTTLTSTDEELYHSISVFHQAKKELTRVPHLIGMHLEGPYFSPAMCGAQDPAYIKNPDPSFYRSVIDRADGAIVRWSVAPELPGAPEMGLYLRDHGIVASMGHSNAEYDDVLKGYEYGYSLLTHFYCAMSTIVRKGGFRHLGMIESGYLIPGLDVEIIADGCHLPLALLELIHRIKGTEHTALITDAMRGAGASDGYSILGSLENGQKVLIEDGVAKLLDHSAFAGSVATSDRLVRTMVRAGVSMLDAVNMMTLTPARILHQQSSIGALRVGLNADMVVFDDDVTISKVYLGGEAVL